MSGHGMPLAAWADTLLEPARVVAAHELDQIGAAGAAIAQRILAGGRLLTFGAGHSWSVAAELCSRAGGVADVVAMSLADIGEHRDQWLQLADSAPERDPDLALPLLRHHGVTGADALLIVSNSARNGMPIELAGLARDAGCLVVAIVSRSHAASVDSRHPSGAKLTDFAEITLDNHGAPGDSVVPVGHDARSGATSTIAGALIAQLLACAIAAKLAGSDEGFTTIRSANLDPEDD